MYNLQKYKGISTRYTCPRCGRKKCFTLYVDEDGEPLHETVGRCDHESSCGYHYTPKQYFADHPDLKPGKDWRDDRPAWLDKPKPKPLCFLPDDVVTRSVRFNHDSDLVAFLKTIIEPTAVSELIEEYRVGVTRSQWKMLEAIAKEGSVAHITASSFLSKYKIASAPTALRNVNALMDKELVLATTDADETSYSVYNVFLARYLEK